MERERRRSGPAAAAARALFAGRKSAPTVLVVDDEPDARGIFAEYLRAKGWIVFTAADGRAAIDIDRLVATRSRLENFGVVIGASAADERDAAGSHSDRLPTRAPDLAVSPRAALLDAAVPARLGSRTRALEAKREKRWPRTDTPIQRCL